MNKHLKRFLFVIATFAGLFAILEISLRIADFISNSAEVYTLED